MAGRLRFSACSAAPHLDEETRVVQLARVVTHAGVFHRILAEGAIALSVTLSGGALFAS